MRSAEYVAVVGSFLLVGLEAVIRILTLALRLCPAMCREKEADRDSFVPLAFVLWRFKTSLQSIFLSSAEKGGKPQKE